MSSLRAAPELSADAVDEIVGDVGTRLAARADARTRDWWERYLKGAIDFRGVPMGEVRKVVHALWADRQLDRLPRDEQLALTLALFRQHYCEDKLAAIIVLSEILIDQLGAREVQSLAEPFQRGYIGDWNTCDWYSIKVLGRLLEHAGDRAAAAKEIADWRYAEGLWQRRAAAVAFVRPARRGDAAVAGLTTLAFAVCETNAQHSERFSQTSVGWLLRELSHTEPAKVAAFVEEHADVLSREARNMATAKLSAALRRRLNPAGRRR